MKVSLFKGAELDYWVAKALKWSDPVERRNSETGEIERWFFSEDGKESMPVRSWHPSSSWAQGGPIIERERMTIEPGSDGWWAASWMDESARTWGSTLLEAATRAFVVGKLGEEVNEEPAR